MPPRKQRELYPADPAHRIYPSGPEDADGMLVGEAGGETEHWQRRPFAGKSGLLLSSYLRQAKIPRPDIRVTNVYPFWTGPGNPDPAPEQIAEYEHLLHDDIALVRPRVIGCLGLIAAQWFLGPDITLDSTHGIPHYSDKAPGAIVLPMYHPAAGFYRPELAARCADDIRRFAYYLNNPPPDTPEPKIEVIEVDAPPRVIRGAAVDTEGLEDRPWGYSWSVDGKTTYVYIVKPGDRAPEFEGRITFQNALHDLVILRALGADTSDMDYDDTMVMLFVLQLEAQGLKPASLRHLNLRMSSFDDVVRPYFNKLALSWIRKAAAFDYPKPRPVVIADYKKRKERLYKPHGVGQRLMSMIQEFTKKPAETKLEDRWAKIGETNETPANGVEKLNYTEQFQGQAEREMRRTGHGPFPDYSIFCVPKKQAVPYSGIDAAATKLLKKPLRKLIEERGLSEVYEMERRALPFVDRMQEVGMGLDVHSLIVLEQELEDLREGAKRTAQKVVGDRWFNPGSGDQVARWLYDVKGLPIMKWTDSYEQGSTADSALKMLRGHNKDDAEVVEFISAIDAYRECDKYLSTFVRPIFILMRRDKRGRWRIHPNFRVTRVVSRRLSSHDPNVLAFPTRTALGKRIRACFVAEEGYVILSVDESQVELRFMAHLSGDRRMQEAFETKIDLHTLTASIIFKVPYDKIVKDGPQRYVAKTINFAVMYGISAPALLDQLYKAEIFDFELEDCEFFISEWFRIYGSVRRFLEGLWKRAAIDGFVRDMWGGICYIPNLNVDDRSIREAAQRLCGNFPVQAGAHGLVKWAEIYLHEWIKRKRYENEIKPWLQIHDELLLETKQEMVEDVAEQVKKYMVAHQDKISVPLKAEAAWAGSWGGLKK